MPLITTVAAGGPAGGLKQFSVHSTHGIYKFNSWPLVIGSTRETMYTENSTGPVNPQSDAEIENFFSANGYSEANTVFGPSNNTYFNVPGGDGYMFLVVPTTGTYRIAAHGAPGGWCSNDTVWGRSAHVQGDFHLNEGDVLWMTVGQAGARGNTGTGDYAGAGGGGLSAVAKSNTKNTSWDGNNTLLLMAAGGVGQAEPRHGNRTENVNAATANQGSSGSGWSSWQSKNMNGRSGSYRGQTNWGGFGGGIAADDQAGGGGGYDGLYNLNPNSYINPSLAANKVRQQSAVVTFPHSGRIFITLL